MKFEHIDSFRELGLRISMYRKLKGYTQEQLAEKIGKSLAYVGGIEAPGVDRACSLRTVFDIAAALEIPVYKLFLFEEDHAPS